MDWGELGSLGKGYCYSFYCVLSACHQIVLVTLVKVWHETPLFLKVHSANFDTKCSKYFNMIMHKLFNK